MKLVKQEPCQISKVGQKNTKTGKNKYEEIVNKYFTNLKKASIVFFVGGVKAIPNTHINQSTINEEKQNG
jgi:hypothetical protein